MPNHRPQQSSKELRASRVGPVSPAVAKRGLSVSPCLAGPQRSQPRPTEPMQGASGQGREAAATSKCKPSELPSHSHVARKDQVTVSGRR